MLVSAFRKSLPIFSVSLFLVTLFSTAATPAWAWGKRGHSIVCQTAAYLAADLGHAEFMKEHSFDLGYYCNVPDLVWKNTNYEQEWFNHFMDMEIFERELKKPGMERNFEAALAMDRDAFNAAYPAITNKAGRSFWRIRELMSETHKLSTELRRNDLTLDDRHRLQGEWLVHLGAVGHYVGDLGQPLHVTENYDGQMTGQKGLHVWFEDQLVDQLFHAPKADLESEVMAEARRQSKAHHQANAAKSVDELTQELAKISNKVLAKVLEIDKKVRRRNQAAAMTAYHQILIECMARGAVTLSELATRELGWQFDGNKFYSFVGAPVFIPVPTAAAGPSPTPSSTPYP